MPSRISFREEQLSQPTLPDEVYERLERVLDRFEAACQSGGRPSLDDYLAQAQAERRVLLRELVPLDLEYRLEAGEPMGAADYLARFPNLAEDGAAATELIAAEFVLREARQEAPRLQDYQARFPAYAEALRERVEARRARRAAGLPQGQAAAEKETVPSVPPSRESEAATLPPPVGVPEGVDRAEVPSPHLPSTYPSLGASANPPARQATSPQRPWRLGRYELGEEIAHGGMGSVLLARDQILNRDLAVKVLKPDLRNRPELVRRFIEEAQITAQLPHPGIVPVHELGRDDNGLPFLVMKLVRGQTLAQLLARRSSPAEDLPRFVGIFEQVCQAVAFAHAHRVIHRDLKPANVMVGRFGEVQVMDWGLAKPLDQAPTEEEKAAGEAAASVIRTLRTGPTAALLGSSAEHGFTQAGTVLGTPAYMSPEQASGQVHKLDERCDVFGLGAILCEILTGSPPYVDAENWRLVYLAACGQQVETYRRLEGCGADEDLVSLVKDCLSADTNKRPRDAGELARRVAAHQQGVEERLRQAEQERSAAQARAQEEGKRRRLTLALAGAFLVIVALGGGGSVWILRQQAERERDTLAREVEKTRQIQDALAHADKLREQARLANDDPGKWAEARAIAQGAEAQLEGVPANSDLGARVRTLVRELNEEENDRRLVADLDKIQLAKADFDPKTQEIAEEKALPAYAHAFVEHGLNLWELSADELAQRVVARPARIRDALVAAPDDWLGLARQYKAAEVDRLARVVDATDRDPWRQRLRLALARDDKAALDRLAGAAEFGQQRPQTILLLAGHLARTRKSLPRACELLRAAQQRFPADFWINYLLSDYLSSCVDFSQNDPAEYDESIRFATVALALRPDNPDVLYSLGSVLLWRGRYEEARAAFQRAIHLVPDFARAHNEIGNVFHLTGRFAEAAVAYKKAVTLQPHFASGHVNLGLILWKEPGQLDEAIVEFRKSVTLADAQPKSGNSSLFRANLGGSLMDKGRVNEALAAYRKTPAEQIMVLLNTGQANIVADGCRKAIAAQPEDVNAHLILAASLSAQGKFAEARVAFQHAQELGPKRPVTLLLPVARWTQDVGRMRAIDSQWSDYVSGKVKPYDRVERRLLTGCCLIRKEYLVAARLHADGLSADPQWADDLHAEARYDAARYAALVASGQGQGAASLTEAERGSWRKRSVEWLRAELTRWEKYLETAAPLDRTICLDHLHWWQQEPDLAAIRDDKALAALAAGERDACQRLWADVEAVLKRFQAK